MQCVIIAAGKGTRMRPLTETTPKPLIPICGKPLIDHIVEALPAEVDEIIMVVGYLADQLRAHCGEEFHGRKVQYVEQADFAGGTGDALMCTQGLVRNKFLLINGDDIYGRDALATIIKEDHAIFSMVSDTPERFGVLAQNDDSTLKEIIEKPQNPESNLVNIGGYVLQPSIFDYKVSVSEEHGEVLVTDMVTEYAKDNQVKIVEQDLWLPIGYPEHIEAAEKILCPEYIESKTQM